MPVSATPNVAPPTDQRTPIGEHTGFYFQGALGIGFVSIEDNYEGPDIGTQTIRGSGAMASVLLGDGVGSGFVLGGGIESVSGTFDYKDEWINGGGGTNEDDVDATGSTVFAMAQKYLGPVFLRVELGAMTGTADDSDEVDYGGFMIAGGVGADFLVSNTWSLGGVATIRRTSKSYSDEDDYSGDYTMTVSSIQVTGTYF